MLSVAYFSFIAERNPERFPELGRAMGENVNSLPEKEKPFAFITGLKKLIKNIGMEEMTLSRAGVKKDDIPTMAENAFYAMGGLFDVTPVKMTKEDVIEIFERAY